MEEASLQQINIKTPEFMEMAVNGWFSILEAQFHLRNITASTTTILHGNIISACRGGS